MRDGVKLFTSVYVPKDHEPALSDLAQPDALRRRAVRRRQLQGGPRAVGSISAHEGYIVVYQDVRGRWMSEGEFVEHAAAPVAARPAPHDIDESTDTFDTIDWLIKHVPNHNGRVGMWGISYPGFYTAAGMIDAHPALEGGIAPGARHRLVHRRRLAPQRRLSAAARLQLPRVVRPSAPGADQETIASASITARPTATRSS